MSADRYEVLRRAASQMREMADRGYVNGVWGEVSLPLAEWLDWQASLDESWDTAGGSHSDRALAVARAYLGEAA